MTNPSLDLVAAFRKHHENLVKTLAWLRANGYPYGKDTLRKELIALGALNVAERRKDGVAKPPQLSTSFEVSLQPTQESEDVRIARIVAMAVQSTLQGMGWQQPQVARHSPLIVSPEKPKAKTLIFTGWEMRVKPNAAFIDCLRQMAAHYKAELYLVPLWPKDVDFLPPVLRDFRLATSTFPVNDNAEFHYVPTHALSPSPILGWQGAKPDRTLIIPGLVRDQITEASVHLAKQVISTGSIGALDPNLTDYDFLKDENERKELLARWNKIENRRCGRIYALAQQYTVPSALIVDVIDDKHFLPRYVAMPNPQQNYIYDLNLKFTAGKDRPESVQPEAIMLGDLHASTIDSECFQASLAQIEALRPRTVIVQDVVTFESVNPHTIDRAAYFSSVMSLEDEREVSRRVMQQVAERAEQVMYLESNHDRFVTDFLDRPKQWRINNNYKAAVNLEAYRINTGKHPVIEYLGLSEFSNVEFVPERENRTIGGNVPKHGHEGKGGKRVGFRDLARAYSYCYAQGHTHSPGFFRGAMNVGMNERYDVDYAVGVSARLQGNGIMHADRSQQQLPIIQGKWRL